jgi:hypothetical protein
MVYDKSVWYCVHVVDDRKVDSAATSAVYDGMFACTHASAAVQL